MFEMSLSETVPVECLLLMPDCKCNFSSLAPGQHTICQTLIVVFTSAIVPTLNIALHPVPDTCMLITLDVFWFFGFFHLFIYQCILQHLFWWIWTQTSKHSFRRTVAGLGQSAYQDSKKLGCKSQSMLLVGVNGHTHRLCNLLAAAIGQFMWQPFKTLQEYACPPFQ